MMQRLTVLKHEFVEYIPNDLKDGAVYISIPFATVAHKCCCGCGHQVITPLSPTDWELTFDGESISLDPSIGNWAFPCESHYWIKRNRVVWARRWSRKEIAAGREQDQRAKQKYFDSIKDLNTQDAGSITRRSEEDDTTDSFWGKLKTWWSHVGV